MLAPSRIPLVMTNSPVFMVFDITEEVTGRGTTSQRTGGDNEELNPNRKMGCLLPIS